MPEFFSLPSSLRLVAFSMGMLVVAMLLFCAVCGAICRRNKSHLAYIISLLCAILLMTIVRTPLIEGINEYVAYYSHLILFVPLGLAVYIAVSEKRYVLLVDAVWCAFNLPFLSVIPYYGYIATASLVVIMARTIFICKSSLENMALYPGRLAIKYSLDRTNDGVAFVNIFGRITYLNTILKWTLADMGISSYARATKIIDAVKAYAADGGRKISDTSYIVYIKDSAFRFAFDEPLTQISCVNVTEEEQLVKESEHNQELLKDANAELNEALNTIESVQKERELLRVKGLLHDELAQHLSILHMFILNDNSGDLKQIKDMLSSLEIAPSDMKEENTLEALANTLSTIDVSLKTSGDIPCNPHVQALVYKLAKEATTNAIKHAKAREIEIDFSTQNDKFTICAQNSGIMPKDIVFGNGLTTLKSEVEALGGNLEVKCDDKFVLTVSLPTNC